MVRVRQRIRFKIMSAWKIWTMKRKPWIEMTEILSVTVTAWTLHKQAFVNK